MVSTDKGINGTVSEAVSSVKPLRRMRRKASVVWRSSDDVNDEAEGTKDANSRRGGRHEGRNLSGDPFTMTPTTISGSWVQGIEVYGDIIVVFE